MWGVIIAIVLVGILIAYSIDCIPVQGCSCKSYSRELEEALKKLELIRIEVYEVKKELGYLDTCISLIEDKIDELKK